MHKRLYILLVLLGAFLAGSAGPVVLPGRPGRAATGKANEVHHTPAHQKQVLELGHLQISAGTRTSRPLPKDPGGSSLSYHHSLWFPLSGQLLPLASATDFENQYIDHIYPTHHFW